MAFFTQGQRVEVEFKDGHKEQGSVAYQRMAAPSYREAEAVSVVLDSRLSKLGYSGTMFLAEKVRSIG